MNRRWIGPGLIALYLLASVVTAMWFPFVHSDEAWLASLSRAMMRSGSVAVTEPFFELTPRHPHAIKTLYHLVQIPFLRVSFSPPAARFPSILAGGFFVVALFQTLRLLGCRRAVALAITTAAAVDIQLLYTFHLARQEALLVAMMMGGAWIVAGGSAPYATAAKAGIVVAVAVFMHPNAFVVAAALFPWVVLNAPATTRGRATTAIIYVSILAAAAVLVVAASVAMDPEFFRNYLAFGEAVGVADSPLRRILRLGAFFTKLSGRVAGTYYLPPVRLLFALGGAVVLGAGAIIVAGTISGGVPDGGVKAGGPKVGGVEIGGPKDVGVRGEADTPTSRRLPHEVMVPPVLSLIAVIVALVIIGKYSPPSIVFPVPFVYILAGLIVDRFASRRRGPAIVALTLLIGSTAAVTAAELAHWYPRRASGRAYRDLSREIRDVLEEENLAGRPVLANLNLAFALSEEELLAIRDLGALPAQEDDAQRAAVDTLLIDRGIGTVILPRTEMDLVYAQRPVWNDVYGNPSRFYPFLLEILDRRGELVAELPAPVYGLRLVSLLGRTERPVTLHVFRLVADGNDPQYRKGSTQPVENGP